jgi:hypothetical protein
MYIAHIFIKVFINSTEISCVTYFRSIYVNIASKIRLSGKHDHVGNVMSSTLIKYGGASCSDKKDIMQDVHYMKMDNSIQYE